MEASDGQVDFAPDFNDFGEVLATEAEWEGADGFEIFGDLVSRIAVAASGASFEDTIFVAEIDGEAIDFGFDEPGEGFT